VAPFHVVPLQVENLPHLQPSPFVCIVGGSVTDVAIEAFIQRTGQPILHLSTAPQPPARAQSLSETTRLDLFRWLERLRQYFTDAGHPDYLDALPWANGFVDWPEQADDYVALHHNVTLPNELTLEAFGHVGAMVTPLPRVVAYGDVDLADAPFVVGIESSVERLVATRARVTRGQPLRPGTVSLILTVPSTVREWGRAASKSRDPHIRRLLTHFVKQAHYPQFVDDRDFFEKVKADRLSQGLIQTRQAELRLYTALLCAQAASHLAPVIRLPPHVNRVSALVQRMAGALASDTPQRRSRAHELAQEVGQWLGDNIPQKFQNIIDRPQLGIKIIGDAPLEWLPIRGLPLALRFTVSRIPGTPGDVLVKAALSGNKIFISKAKARELLVIRSFEDDDPIRTLLERAIREYLRDATQEVDVTFVDVSSEEQVISALNESSADIVVFDCHGSHDSDASGGALIIGSDRVNPAAFGARARIPPVVVLAACETHPLNSSSMTVGAGFLWAGATTVLTTVSKIDARSAAMIVGRLALRLSEFLPHLEAPMPWSEVVSGLLRMAYVFDVINGVTSAPGGPQLTPLQMRQLMFMTNVEINTFKGGWFELLLAEIANCANMPLDNVERMWRSHAYASESLLYLQLGNPEAVWIVEDGATPW